MACVVYLYFGRHEIILRHPLGDMHYGTVSLNSLLHFDVCSLKHC